MKIRQGGGGGGETGRREERGEADRDKSEERGRWVGDEQRKIDVREGLEIIT